jgi:hypothetical protein
MACSDLVREENAITPLPCLIAPSDFISIYMPSIIQVPSLFAQRFPKTMRVNLVSVRSLFLEGPRET